MSTSSAVTAALLLSALGALLDGYHHARHAATPFIVSVAFNVTLAVMSYAWYRSDARALRYVGTTALGGSIALFSLVAVPVYLFKSRSPPQRVAALARFAALVAACLGIHALGVCGADVLRRA